MPIVAKCSSCGEPFERLFKFCPNCGLSILGEGFTDKGGVAVRDLFEIARSFSSVTDLDILLRKISTAAEKLTQSETSSVMLLDDHKQYLYFRYIGGEKGKLINTIKVPIGQGIAGWVAQNNQPLLVEDVSQDPRFSVAFADDKSGFKTKSILCVPMTLSDEMVGVLEVLNKKPGAAGAGKFTADDREILESLAGFAAVSIINSKLTANQKNFSANTLEVLIAAIENESRGKNLPGHCWRVAQSSCAVARRMKITDQAYKDIYYASLLHDIGYIGLRRQILMKKAMISQERAELLHPEVGAGMVEPITMLKNCAPLILAHQEHWNGTGFPNRLKGEDIPLGSRIIGLVEALEDQRESGMSEDEFRKQAERYASDNADLLFDPQVVAAYLVEASPAMGSHT